MIPWIHLDSVRLPDGGELRLAQRGGEFSIRLAPTARTVGTELMNSRMFGSEEALAQLACERLAQAHGVVLPDWRTTLGPCVAAILADEPPTETRS